jgi:hypothetical protein
MSDKEFEPQFICMTCKKVIGPIWDDNENQCDCQDQAYSPEVWRVVSENELEAALEAAKEEMDGR